MESGKDPNAKPTCKDIAESNSFDYIQPSAKKTTAINNPTHGPTGEVEQTSTRRHLQQDKSTVYLATSTQKTSSDNGAMGKELLDRNSVSPEQGLSTSPRQRRCGVTHDVTSEQRQRKHGITENTQSVNDRTFLRVLHKKF